VSAVTPPVTPPGSTPVSTATDVGVAPVRVRWWTDLRPGDEVRVVGMVWLRELLRYGRTRTRILSGLVQPVLFLFVLGYGLAGLVGSTGGFDFRQFVFPGVVAMSVAFTAMAAAISVVWDREFGFLREMLVAPVSRTALVLGKVAGGATVGTLQGSIMLLLAPLVGVRLTPTLVLTVIGLELVLAATMTSFGVFLASRIQRMEGFQVVMQMVLLPMLFLSGALFPLHGLPGWLAVITRLNPLTYIVDPLRRAIFAAQPMTPQARVRFGSGVEVFGHVMTTPAELTLVAAFVAVFTVLAVRGLARAR
jgi:ABC-2 type transport system permease protein